MRSVAAIAMIALVLVLAGGGHLLSRIDRTRAQAELGVATARAARAETELLRARFAELADRDVKPDNVIERVDVCVRRTDALRKAIFALVRTGTVAMPGDPGGDWAVWPLELAVTTGERR